jgi:small subunit ribosomal protein S20
MPITKQAIKQMRQNAVHKDRNKHYISRMKSMIKLFMEYVKNNESAKAAKVLPQVFSAIDTAVKKHLLHKNNAARKKSRLQKSLGAPVKAKVEKKTK